MRCKPVPLLIEDPAGNCEQCLGKLLVYNAATFQGLIFLSSGASFCLATSVS